MFKYETTVKDLQDAHLVAWGDEGSQKLIENMLAFMSPIDVENVYARALHKVREDLSGE